MTTVRLNVLGNDVKVKIEVSAFKLPNTQRKTCGCHDKALWMRKVRATASLLSGKPEVLQTATYSAQDIFGDGMLLCTPKGCDNCNRAVKTHLNCRLNEYPTIAEAK